MKKVLFLLLILSGSFSVFAQTSKTVVASQRAEKGTAILKQFAALDADSMPIEVFRKAKAVGVFNDVTQINLLLSSGTKGRGLLCVRTDSGWSIPIFMNFGSSSFKFKIAEKKTFDVVYFIMDDKTADFLKKKGITPGKIADERLAAGPVVGGKGADTVLKSASILYYTFSNGKITGEEFQNDGGFFSGVVFSLDNIINENIYGKKAKILLTENTDNIKVPEKIEEFRTVLKSLDEKSKSADSANPQKEESNQK